VAENDLTTKRLWIAVLVAIVGGNSGSFINAFVAGSPNEYVNEKVSRELEKEVHRIDSIQQTILYRMGNCEETNKEYLRQQLFGGP